MKPGNKIFTEVPLEIVGSSTFGRYPKISVEQTYNMIISDGWLVPFAGYRTVLTISPQGQGRGIFASDKLNKIFLVIDNAVYWLSVGLALNYIGNINTFFGDVFIQANNADQVAFSDSQDIWIYNNTTGDFTKATDGVNPTLGFTPGYIGFQNGRFISPDLASNSWRLSDVGNGLIWQNDIQFKGAIQTKPDTAQAAVRVPSKGNLLFIFGKTVTEAWYDVGAQLFPYQRSTNYNVDYGCANPNTIAYLDKYVAWLGKNEEAGYAIMVADGGSTVQLSTDGINYLIAHLSEPDNCYGYFFKQDGHVLYAINWPADNLSYVYDFETKKFFNISDDNMNAHIAKRVVFFNGTYYFISFVDGNLYELNSELYTADGEEIPRIRVTKNIRLPDQSRFVLANLGFTVEQGAIDFDNRDTRFGLSTEDGQYLITTENGLILGGGYNYQNNLPRIDLSLSKDGGENWGSEVPKFLNPLGRRKNRCWWNRLGEGNDIVPQIRFWAKGRFLATNGVASIYQ